MLLAYEYLLTPHSTMDDITAPPPKRRRMSTQESTATDVDIIIDAKPATNGSAAAISNTNGEQQLEKEQRVGITAYVHPDASGFTGILKQRYYQLS